MAQVPAIGLDFVRPGGGTGRFGPLLLIAGAVSALAVLEHQRVLARAVQEGAAEVEEMHSMSRRAMPSIAGRDSDTPEVRQQIQKANAVLAQMNVPWGELFAAVETAQDGSVGLLAIQPDARARNVAIGGEARSLPAVLAYMGRLQGSERLRDVVLASHEIKLKEPGQPVEFVLNARWVEAP
jgi:Tfp pilus assembly protein PilN